MGFIGTPPGVTAPPLTDTNYVVTNLTCPEGEQCTSTVGSSGCSSYGGGYAAVTCIICMPYITCTCSICSVSIHTSIHLIIY